MLLSELRSPSKWFCRVERSFSRAASTYDGVAEVQQATARELCARILREPAIQLERILDVGTGTGALALLLAALLPGSRISGCDISAAMVRNATRKARGCSLTNVHFRPGPAECLPYPAEHFSLAVSSLALHWADDPQSWISEQARVLRPGGSLYFATSAPDTLPELRSTLQAVSGEGTVPYGFPPQERLAEILQSEGFAGISLEIRTFVETRDSARSLFTSMRDRGVRLPPPGHQPLSISQIRSMLALYETRFGGPKGIKASYRIIFGKGTFHG